MATIHLLSDQAIDQIAAGEVVEGPASVVKELVENAIDAGAKKISVEITGGGLKAIRVSDDGRGMNGEDALLSTLRHATSKITGSCDLLKLKTMGFRGEALAAIASISKMTLMTAVAGSTGTKLEIEKGEVVKKRPVARTNGTTIEVRDLFYNVPARKKFQKSVTAISAEIFRLITVMSLGNPDVCFELISNKRKTIQTSFSKDLKMRAEELLGKEFLERSLEVDFHEGPLRFTGILGAPTNSRANRLGQYLFINHRAVSCDPISEAIKAGYGTRLEERRYPIFLLHLDVPADLVDVNVHPQKLEVRLREETLFREKINDAVSKAFEEKSRAPAFVPRSESLIAPAFYDDIPLRFHEDPVEDQFDLPIEEEKEHIIGLFSHFLIIEEREELAILDLQAARSRIIFDRLTENRDGEVEKQNLLVPFSIDLTSIESAMVMTHLDAIEEMGFSLSPIGRDAFMVQALPSFVDEKDVKELISSSAKALQSFIGKLDYEEKRRRELASVAAGIAKGKNQFSNEEARQIYKELNQSKSPAHCPKGRPTMIKWSHDELKSAFKSHQKTAKAAIL